MFRKLKLIEKSKSRDANFIFEEFKNTIQTTYIFVSKNLRQSNLNFETKILIELSFKHLKFLS